MSFSVSYVWDRGIWSELVYFLVSAYRPDGQGGLGSILLLSYDFLRNILYSDEL